MSSDSYGQGITDATVEMRSVTTGIGTTGVNFVKVYSSILDSSIWAESSDTRILWLTLMAMASPTGHVEASVGGLARRAKISREACEAGLAIFMAPDPDSMNPEHEGRRVERTERGWRLLNFVAFRERRTALPGEEARNYVYYFLSRGEVKIGTSRNPWARAKDMKTSRPDITVLATERGGFELEKRRHDQFKSARIIGEWFTYTPELRAHINQLRRPATPTTVADVAPTVVYEEREVEGEGEREGEEPRQAEVDDAERATSPLSHIPPVEKSDAPAPTPPDPTDPVRLGLTDRARSIDLTVALNQGLHDNPAVGEHPQPVLANSATSLEAAIAIAEMGVHHEWAVRAAYTIGRRFKPDRPGQTIGSLAYLPPRFAKPWEQRVARDAAAASERPQELGTGVDEGKDTAPPSSSGENARRSSTPRRDLKGEGLLIFGRLRDAVREEPILTNPEMGLAGGNRLERRIRADVLAELDEAGKDALAAIGGERAITHPRDRDGADALGWKFAGAYAAAAGGA